jgi:hypothetical protein
VRPIRCAAATLIALFALPLYAQDFIGAEKCKSCHEFEFRVWSAGPHARAHQSLSPEQLKDPKCNSCHTMVPANLEAELLGVQCERCHGPGKYYHPSYVMKDKELARAVGLVDPIEQHCRSCHTEGTPSIRPFDFVRMWGSIDHGKKARQAYEAAQARAEVPGK